MAAFQSKTAVMALALTVLMTASVGLAATVTSPTAHAIGSPASSGAHVASTAPSAPKSAPAPNPAPAAPATTNVAASMASAALAATKAAGLKSNVVFVPRPSASPGQVAAAAQSGVVTPLYTGSPAPMGLGYYGLSAAPNGSVVGTVLNTTSLVATINMNSTGVRGADLFQSSPDSYGIQLNAVVTNITLFGQGGYSFWTQNVVEFYPDTNVMFLVTNVWNFSGGPLSTNVFYQHGPLGHQVGTEYYYAEGELGGLAYPFNITLFMNSTISGGRNMVGFNVGFQFPGSPAQTFFPYDYVIFNSTKPVGGVPLTVPSNYTANGLHYNPIGLTDDFELIFGGPGGGSQATLFAADATLGLGYWDPAAHGGLGGYVSVPSAYSYGGETGETVTGANVAWSNDPLGSPLAGLTTYGTMTTGPSVLTGLWNASAPEGSYPVLLAVTPSNAFNVFATSIGWNANFTISELAVAPELYTNVVYLIPGNYVVETELADYAPVFTQIDVSGPTILFVTLTPSPAFGVYTPLWAFSNSQIAAISTSGAGTPSSPYIIDNNQHGLIGSEFGLYNDYIFPVYPGVFFYGTTATVEFLHPPSLETATNTFQYPGPQIPSTNDLQYWFWNVTNVAVVGGTNISGWFGATAFYPSVFDTFNMIFYEGGHNLIAGNTFDSMGGALLMFSGGTFFGPLNVGGGNNTVWGNTFNEVGTPASTLALEPGFFGLGMEIAESNDLIYNNAVYTPTTAWLLPINLYSGFAEFFYDQFNIAKTSASVVNHAAGFPFVALTGSIIGTSYQGGNFWWDYGLVFNPYNGADNPYGVLPYDENAPTLLVDVYGPAYYYATYIYPGGDLVPLTTVGELYSVTISESGLPSGLVWGAAVTDASASLVADFETTGTSSSFQLPNGTYDFALVVPGGWSYTGTSTSFTVHGASVSVGLAFALTKGYRTLTFKEKGLPSGTTWSVTLNATTPSDYYLNATESSKGTSIVFAVTAGHYTFKVNNVVGYASSPKSGSETIVKGNAKVSVKFTALTYTVTFTETGLTAGAKWSVKVGKKTVSTTGTSLTFTLSNGTYSFSVKAPKGTTAHPASGTFTVAGPGKTVAITFTG